MIRYKILRLSTSKYLNKICTSELEAEGTIGRYIEAALFNSGGNTRLTKSEFQIVPIEVD